MVKTRATGDTAIKVFVHSRYGLGARQSDADYAAGIIHNPRPYGFETAARPGIDVSFSEDSRSRKLSRLLRPILGFDVAHALYNLRAIRSADISWTLLEEEWLSIALLQAAGLAPRRPIIANSVWMMNDWATWGRRRRWIWRWLMRMRNVHMTLHSEAAKAVADREFPDKDFTVEPFGISTVAFPPQAPRAWSAWNRPIRVYSIGYDRTRDWPTLLSAFGNDQRFEVRVISKWIDEVIDVESFWNLEVPRTELISAQRESFEWADVVVMPMRPNVFSGITVVCEAVANGVPVVSSNTGGVPTYFNSDEILLVPPSDPEALRTAVLSATPEDWNRRAAAASVRFKRSDYSSEGMVERYIGMTERLLGHR